MLLLFMIWLRCFLYFLNLKVVMNLRLLRLKDRIGGIICWNSYDVKRMVLLLLRVRMRLNLLGWF